MRVGLNVEQLLSASPGGIGRYTARLASLLPVDVVAFCARHGTTDMARVSDELGMDVTALGLPRPLLYDAWHLLGGPPLRFGASALRDLDVVHAPSVATPPSGPYGLVVTVHDVATERFPEAFTKRGRRFHAQGLAAAGHRADALITVSEAAADEVSAVLPSATIHVIHNGVDARMLEPEVVRAELEGVGLLRRPYVLWVGSLEPRKGVDTLVAAMADVVEAGHDDVALVLAGYQGWLHDGVITAEDRARLGDALIELGPVSDQRLTALYAGAELFAFPSRHEGFGLPVLEAMAQGTAVICSDIPALREIAGGHAELVGVGERQAWVEVLSALLDDETRRQRMGTAGHAHAVTFTWERTAAATRAVYDTVV